MFIRQQSDVVSSLAQPSSESPAPAAGPPNLADELFEEHDRDMAENFPDNPAGWLEIRLAKGLNPPKKE